MRKGKGKSKRKQMSDVIPSSPKASITDSMRKERSSQGEVFENVQTAHSAGDKSSRSIRTRSKRTIRSVRNKHLKVEILPAEPPINFENDILSVYTQTQGTISLDSVSDIDPTPLENLKKKQKPSNLQPEKPITAKKVKANIEDPPKALPITDALFCERIQPGGPYMAENRKGDLEMEFVNQLIENVLGIVNGSGSTELELKITLDREDNGLPKVQFELIPKSRLKNPIDRLNRAYVQYAKFHEELGVLSDCETATSKIQQSTGESPIITSKGGSSRFSLLAVFNSMFSGSGSPRSK
uniref:Phosphoprotein n=1 Tax=Haemonchus contortus TaxID=6289 RepID=A0A7I4Y6U1_HAECO